jgi:ABC-type sulfate transport system substrate-binding protein
MATVNVTARRLRFYRPRDATVAGKYNDQFPQLPRTLATIDAPLGGWEKAQAAHFQRWWII